MNCGGSGVRLGIYVLGIAAIAAGAIDIVWGGFERAHQPIQAFGTVPGAEIFAYAVAALLIAGGAAICVPRTARFGAPAVGLAYAIFTVFWLPRLYTAPQVLGLHASVIIGVFGGVFQELIVVAAAALVYAYASPPDSRLWNRASGFARWIFGLSALDFGLNHLTAIAATAPLVPAWMPPNATFWVVFTGLAFVLAGVAILIGVLDVLAARLLSVMLLVFSVFALAPGIFAYPHNQIPWGSNAYNLAAAASVWIFASWIASRAVEVPRRAAVGA
jgi:uncharacterized membrane protein